MKKVYSMFLAMAAFVAVALTSCSEFTDEYGESNSTPYMVRMSVPLAMSPELAKVVDVTATFLDANGSYKTVEMPKTPVSFKYYSNGQEVTEQLCQINVEKSSIEFPAYLNVSYTFTRTDYTPAGEKLEDVKVVFLPGAIVLNQRGETLNLAGSGGVQDLKGVQVDKLDNLVNSLSTTYGEASITVDANGKITF